MHSSRVAVSIVAFVTLSVPCVITRAEEPRDFLDYVAKARESGMTESAQSSLMSIASIRTGGTLLKFTKSSAAGQYGRSYSSVGCPVPGADPEKVAKFQADLKAKETTDLLALRKYADADGSGFVSTREASSFRDLMEFGLFADFILHDEGGDLDALARASFMKAKDVRGRIESYDRVAEGLNAASPYKMPIVSLEDEPGDKKREDR
jgi:hypothetical protein